MVVDFFLVKFLFQKMQFENHCKQYPLQNQILLWGHRLSQSVPPSLTTSWCPPEFEDIPLLDNKGVSSLSWWMWKTSIHQGMEETTRQTTFLRHPKLGWTYDPKMCEFYIILIQDWKIQGFQFSGTLISYYILNHGNNSFSFIKPDYTSRINGGKR